MKEREPERESLKVGAAWEIKAEGIIGVLKSV